MTSVWLQTCPKPSDWPPTCGLLRQMGPLPITSPRPAWPVTVHEVVQAMAQIDPQVPQRVQFAPQPDLEAQFGAWPLDVTFALAQQLALTDERQTFKHDLSAFLRHLA